VSHIGHARNYICSDAIRRIMVHWLGLPIHLVMNITDIDDKILNKAKAENSSISAISKKFTQSYMNDMDRLNVLPPDSLT